MVAVGSPSEGTEVVAEVFSDEQARAVGEYDVVFGEAFLGDRR